MGRKPRWPCHAAPRFIVSDSNCNGRRSSGPDTFLQQEGSCSRELGSGVGQPHTGRIRRGGPIGRGSERSRPLIQSDYGELSGDSLT